MKITVVGAVLIFVAVIAVALVVRAYSVQPRPDHGRES